MSEDDAPDRGNGLGASVVRRSMLGAHRHLVRVRGQAVRYHADVSVFLTLPREPAEQDWADAIGLSGTNASLYVGETSPPPELWRSVSETLVFAQLIHPGDPGHRDRDVVTLGPKDVGDMKALVAMTNPGPFGPRTIELGRYVGIRDQGRLVAMAGERWRVPGFTEISMVCTDPQHQGRGLATRVTNAVAVGVGRRGHRPFLHVKDDNEPAMALYRKLGFVAAHTVRAWALNATDPTTSANEHGPVDWRQLGSSTP